MEQILWLIAHLHYDDTILDELSLYKRRCYYDRAENEFFSTEAKNSDGQRVNFYSYVDSVGIDIHTEMKIKSKWMRINANDGTIVQLERINHDTYYHISMEVSGALNKSIVHFMRELDLDTSGDVFEEMMKSYHAHQHIRDRFERIKGDLLEALYFSVPSLSGIDLENAKIWKWNSRNLAQRVAPLESPAQQETPIPVILTEESNSSIPKVFYVLAFLAILGYFLLYINK
ncbi:hypothetical protein [Pedobacter namyangjuensis]|uniref:hypothetical protein n=1 Tax=Pedobacter namyangjuensis TaxID=600626 RepID=UPI000DE4EA84|nr:hypothetical protein [Pedobacter namyangjuensis]